MPDICMDERLKDDGAMQGRSKKVFLRRAKLKELF
jgi:hypothetical protein